MISSKMFRPFVTLALSFVFAAAAHGQRPITSTWESAQAELVNTKDTLYVVTIAHPKSRHACLMQSINASGIVCTHRGKATAYRFEDVAAILLRGTHTRWYLYAAGFLAAGGAATWGTVALASICAPCAVITGVAALFLYSMAPASAMLTDGDSDDKVIYLAPGQSLKVSLN